MKSDPVLEAWPRLLLLFVLLTAVVAVPVPPGLHAKQDAAPSSVPSSIPGSIGPHAGFIIVTSTDTCIGALRYEAFFHSA
jgi:hypothetical protein